MSIQLTWLTGASNCLSLGSQSPLRAADGGKKKALQHFFVGHIQESLLVTI